MEADFSGYATKADIKCSDGRTIRAGAFKHQDKVKVPLVWQHGHSDPENVLGHAILENRDDGMYAYAFFNGTPKAAHARNLVEHGDITKLSIWANELVERAATVLHGTIREVSLVLSGANPGAIIENVTIRHSDGGETFLEDEAIIHTGLDIEHEQIAHAEDEEKDNEDDGETVEDIYNSLSDKQKDVVHYIIGEALKTGASMDDGEEDSVQQDNLGEADDDTISHDNSDKEGSDMTTRNIFEKDAAKDKEGNAHVLSHSDMEAIFADAQKTGSLKAAVEAYAEAHLEHGILDLELLFPEARALTNTPEWEKRRTEWVNVVLSGVTKRPFSRIKMWNADITFDEARAKGYIKGTMKKEEFFSISKRETAPTTIYKKQKLDRDDIIDIADFDVVQWMKGEMRIMLDEEIARAILVSDGREVDDEDKIQEDKIRPIATDDPYYTIAVSVNVSDANSSYEEVLDAIILNREQYKGTGTPDFFTTEGFIAKILLLRDNQGRKLYRSIEEVASEHRLGRIVPVEILNEYPDILGIMVNLTDYSVGTDKGGEVSMFDDFDIDYNQYKYLIEGRMSGSLTKPHSAMVFYKAASGDVSAIPTAPTWDAEAGEVTIPTVTGIEYRDASDGSVLAAGAVPVDPGTTLTVQAWAKTGYYVAPGYKTRWSYLAVPA